MTRADLARRWPWTVPLGAQVKALVAGLVAAGASAITSALADGVVTGEEGRAIVGAAVAGYLLTFAVRNATTPSAPASAGEPGGTTLYREGPGTPAD